MKILVMSDIHGNKQALKAVIDKVKVECGVKGCLLLGDNIDYGMHSNEVISTLKYLPFPVLCNICGNHEDAILSSNYERFSSKRGSDSAQYTKSVLSEESWDYIQKEQQSSGVMEFECFGRKCLAVHGSLEDHFWKSIKPGDLLIGYEKYDYVFSGHSHQPHFFEKYYEADNPVRRNMKKTIFINPGSVGQPRNHNPMAQYVILNVETEDVQFCKAEYDIEKEQNTFNDKIDVFYRDRLAVGV